MLKAAVILAAIPAAVVVAVAGLVLLPVIVLVWRLDRSLSGSGPALTCGKME